MNRPSAPSPPPAEPSTAGHGMAGHGMGGGALGRAGGLAAVAYAFTLAMASTTLPTPLYPGYRAEFGFSQLTITVIFATYAVGVIIALLAFGRLSDRVGRRPVLLAGLGAAVASALMFLFAGGLPALLAGRLLSGLSAGVFTGTATATLVDLAPPRSAGRATLVPTIANMGGLGLGPLLAGVIARYGPDPLQLTYVINLALLVPAVLGVLLAPETVSRQARASVAQGAGGARLLSRPRVPSAARAVFVRAALAGFAGFAVLGLFTAVGPAFLAQTLDEHNPLVTGLVVAAVFAGSALGQVLARRTGHAVGLPAGCAALVVGVALVGGAIAASSLPLLVAGAVVAGIGQGLSFASGLGGLLAAAPPPARAETSSAFFVVAYVAISLPVVGVGVLAELTTLRLAGFVFVFVIGLLALTALALLRRGRGAAGTS
nr:MFS transporter [Parafrankia colletiae]